MKESVYYQRSFGLSQSKGLTLLEVLIVIGMMAVLMTISVVAIAKPQQKNSVETTINTFVSDLKQQQLLSMLGDSGSQANAAAHGIRVTSSGYTSFTGSVFTASTNNFTVNLSSGIIFTGATFPLDIIFAKHSGEITPINNLIIQDSSGDQRSVNINQLGGVSVN